MKTASIEFTADRMAEFKKLVARYEEPACALLPTMYLAQDQFGYLTPQIMIYIGKLLNMPPARVFETASFYTMFKHKDMGKHCLQVCTNITCTLMGSEKLIDIIKEDLKIGPHEVTEDKKFSYVPVQCLGSCDTAPVVQVNEDYEENLNPEKFRQLIKDLAQKGGSLQ